MDITIDEAAVVRDFTDEPLLCLQIAGHLEPDDVEAIREQFTERVNHRVIVFTGAMQLLPIDEDSVAVHLLRRLVEAQKDTMSTGAYRESLTDARQFLAALDAPCRPEGVQPSEG